MDNSKFKLNIIGDDGFNFTKTIDKDICDKIVVFATTGSSPISENDKKIKTEEGINKVESQESSYKPQKSIVEYFDEYNPKNNYQKIAVIFFYILEEENKEILNKEITQQLFVKAGQSSPKNLDRDFRDSVKKGFISKTPDDDENYYLTKKGIDSIKKKFLEK